MQVQKQAFLSLSTVTASLPQSHRCSLFVFMVYVGSCSVSAATGYRSELSQAQEAPRVSTHSAVLTAEHGFLKGIPTKKSVGAGKRKKEF
jgi:hypothetical protein